MNYSIQNYPYFFAQLLSLTIFLPLLFVFIKPPHRKPLFISSSIACLCFPLAMVYNESYWRPNRLWGCSVGLEDFLFLFIAGGLAWLPVFFFHRKDLVIEFRWWIFFKKWAAISVIGLPLFIIFHVMNLSPITSFLVVCSILIVFLLLRNRETWRLCVAGVTTFPLLYLPFMYMHFWIWPGYTDYWISEDMWGQFFLGLPIGEIFWALGFGAAWPMIINYLISGHLDPETTTFCFDTD